MSKLTPFYLLFVLFFTVGCATGHPIQNFESQPIAEGVSPQEFESVVMSTTQRGWVFQKTGPNTLLGTLVIRTHEARVEVQHTDSTYSIRYKDSVNLGENGNTIHRNYNLWVRNLHADIRREMLRVAAGTSPSAAPAAQPAAAPASEPAPADNTIQ